MKILRPDFIPKKTVYIQRVPAIDRINRADNIEIDPMFLHQFDRMNYSVENRKSFSISSKRIVEYFLLLVLMHQFLHHIQVLFI